MDRRALAIAIFVGLALRTAQAADSDATAQPARLAAPCQVCHGVAGEGNDGAGFPRLAGLDSTYIATQLRAFADNTRANPVMSPIARALGDAQIDSLSRYLAAPEGASATTAAATTAADDSSTGAWLAQRGHWDRSVPSCNSCHGADGAGVGTVFPRLAGQGASYLARQLDAYASGARPAGPQGLMGAVAKRLSPDERAAVARYYAGLARPTPQ